MRNFHLLQLFTKFLFMRLLLFLFFRVFHSEKSAQKRIINSSRSLQSAASKTLSKTGDRARKVRRRIDKVAFPCAATRRPNRTTTIAPYRRAPPKTCQTTRKPFPSSSDATNGTRVSLLSRRNTTSKLNSVRILNWPRCTNRCVRCCHQHCW